MTKRLTALILIFAMLPLPAYAQTVADAAAQTVLPFEGAPVSAFETGFVSTYGADSYAQSITAGELATESGSSEAYESPESPDSHDSSGGETIICDGITEAEMDRLMEKYFSKEPVNLNASMIYNLGWSASRDAVQNMLATKPLSKLFQILDYQSYMPQKVTQRWSQLVNVSDDTIRALNVLGDKLPIFSQDMSLGYNGVRGSGTENIYPVHLYRSLMLMALYKAAGAEYYSRPVYIAQPAVMETYALKPDGTRWTLDGQNILTSVYPERISILQTQLFDSLNSYDPKWNDYSVFNNGAQMYLAANNNYLEAYLVAAANDGVIKRSEISQSALNNINGFYINKQNYWEPILVDLSPSDSGSLIKSWNTGTSGLGISYVKPSVMSGSASYAGDMNMLKKAFGVLYDISAKPYGSDDGTETYSDVLLASASAPDGVFYELPATVTAQVNQGWQIQIKSTVTTTSSNVPTEELDALYGQMMSAISGERDAVRKAVLENRITQILSLLQYIDSAERETEAMRILLLADDAEYESAIAGLGEVVDATAPYGLRDEYFNLIDFCTMAAKIMHIYGEPVLSDEEMRLVALKYGAVIPSGLTLEQSNAVLYLVSRGIIDSTITMNKLYARLTLDEAILYLSRIADKDTRVLFTAELSAADLTAYDSRLQKVNTYLSGELPVNASVAESYDSKFYDYYIKKSLVSFKDVSGRRIDDVYFALSVTEKDRYDLTTPSLGSRMPDVEMYGDIYYHFKVPIEALSWKNESPIKTDRDGKEYLYLTTADAAANPVCLLIDKGGGVYNSVYQTSKNMVMYDASARISFDSLMRERLKLLNIDGETDDDYLQYVNDFHRTDSLASMLIGSLDDDKAARSIKKHRVDGIETYSSANTESRTIIISSTVTVAGIAAYYPTGFSYTLSASGYKLIARSYGSDSTIIDAVKKAANTNDTSSDAFKFMLGLYNSAVKKDLGPSSDGSIFAVMRTADQRIMCGASATVTVSGSQANVSIVYSSLPDITHAAIFSYGSGNQEFKSNTVTWSTDATQSIQGYITGSGKRLFLSSGDIEANLSIKCAYFSGDRNNERLDLINSQNGIDITVFRYTGVVVAGSTVYKFNIKEADGSTLGLFIPGSDGSCLIDARVLMTPFGYEGRTLPVLESGTGNTAQILNIQDTHQGVTKYEAWPVGMWSNQQYAFGKVPVRYVDGQPQVLLNNLPNAASSTMIFVDWTATEGKNIFAVSVKPKINGYYGMSGSSAGADGYLGPSNMIAANDKALMEIGKVLSTVTFNTASYWFGYFSPSDTSEQFTSDLLVWDRTRGELWYKIPARPSEDKLLLAPYSRFNTSASGDQKPDDKFYTGFNATDSAKAGGTTDPQATATVPKNSEQLFSAFYLAYYNNIVPSLIFRADEARKDVIVANYPVVVRTGNDGKSYIVSDAVPKSYCEAYANIQNVSKLYIDGITEIDMYGGQQYNASVDFVNAIYLKAVGNSLRKNDYGKKVATIDGTIEDGKVTAGFFTTDSGQTKYDFGIWLIYQPISPFSSIHKYESIQFKDLRIGSKVYFSGVILELVKKTDTEMYFRHLGLKAASSADDERWPTIYAAVLVCKPAYGWADSSKFQVVSESNKYYIVFRESAGTLSMTPLQTSDIYGATVYIPTRDLITFTESDIPDEVTFQMQELLKAGVAKIEALRETLDMIAEQMKREFERLDGWLQIVYIFLIAVIPRVFISSLMLVMILSLLTSMPMYMRFTQRYFDPIKILSFGVTNSLHVDRMTIWITGSVGVVFFVMVSRETISSLLIFILNQLLEIAGRVTGL